MSDNKPNLEVMKKWTIDRGIGYISYFMDHFETFLKSDNIKSRTPCEATFAECFK